MGVIAYWEVVTVKSMSCYYVRSFRTDSVIIESVHRSVAKNYKGSLQMLQANVCH